MFAFNKHIITSVLIASVILSGCIDFDDLNTNPDASTKASPSMICTGLLLRIAKFNGRDAKAMVDDNALPKYMGYANEGQMSAQYNSIGGAGFDLLTGLPNTVIMVEYAAGSPMENSYRGIAKFYRAYVFYQLSMQMGDIPYTDTGKAATGNYTPVYDTQESVMKGVLDELAEAEQFFASGVNFDGDPTALKGNAVQWRKAVNAFTIKVLMSLSKKEGVASLNIKNRFAKIVTDGNLFANAQDFFGVEYSSINRHPFYSTSNSFQLRTILSNVVVDNLKRLNDRRLFYYGEPRPDATAAAQSSFDSYTGVNPAMKYADMNTDHTAGKFSALNLRYLNEEASESFRLVTYAEQQLILAEASVLGWIPAAGAESYYKTGVQAALTVLKDNTKATGYAHEMPITQAYIDGYFTGEAAFKTVADDQLKQIWMQRYLLNFMQNAQSSFFEYRRTGYPVFPIDPNTSLNTNKPDALPVRWTYPSSEASYNKENMEAALTRQFGNTSDDINNVMWLLK